MSDLQYQFNLFLNNIGIKNKNFATVGVFNINTLLNTVTVLNEGKEQTPNLTGRPYDRTNYRQLKRSS